MHPLDSRTVIQGELWDITCAETLRRLDQLEGHPDWYTRTPITVEMIECPSAGRQVEAEIYFNSKVSDKPGDDGDTIIHDAFFLPSGDFRDACRPYGS